jgi:O-antigen/teichoic acid export membrane protein
MLFFLPLEDVGIYDFSVKCLIPIELIMNSLHTTIYPKVVSAVMLQEDKGSTLEINRYYHGLTAVIMLLVCGSVLMLPIVIRVAIDVVSAKPEYLEAIQYAPYIAAIYFFKAMRLFFAAPYGILKYTKPLPIIYLIVSGLKIGLVVLLINRYNIFGIIMASIFSAVVEIILLRVCVKGRFQFKFNLFKVVLAPMILLVLIVILEPWVGIQRPFAVHLFYVISCGGILWWAYRNEIKLINPFHSPSR